MMKTLTLSLLAAIGAATAAFAQEGRYELPHDTLSVGGDEQKFKEEQMEAQDDLMNSLAAARDSAETLIRGRAAAVGNQHRLDSLRSYYRDAGSVMEQLRRSERNRDAMRKGYEVLGGIRRLMKESGN